MWYVARIVGAMRDFRSAETKAVERFMQALEKESIEECIVRFQWLWPATRKMVRLAVRNDEAPQHIAFAATMGWITEAERRRRLQAMWRSNTSFLRTTEKIFIVSALYGQGDAKMIEAIESIYAHPIADNDGTSDMPWDDTLPLLTREATGRFAMFIAREGRWQDLRHIPAGTCDVDSTEVRATCVRAIMEELGKPIFHRQAPERYRERQEEGLLQLLQLFLDNDDILHQAWQLAHDAKVSTATADAIFKQLRENGCLTWKGTAPEHVPTNPVVTES
jgi:hypothetical protein